MVHHFPSQDRHAEANHLHKPDQREDAGTHTRQIVAIAPYGRNSGSSRTRVFQWIEHLNLAASTLAFTESTTLGAKTLIQHPVTMFRSHRALTATEIGRDDIVLIQRELGPLTDGTQEARLLRAGARGVYDLDDGIQWDWGVGGGLRRFRVKAEKVIRMVRAANTVIAGNDTIAEWAATYAEHVVVIPTCVEPSEYSKKVNYSLQGPPKLGWVGSYSTERHLMAARTELLTLHADLGASLVLFGEQSGELGELETMITRIPWSESRVHSRLRECDIGLMPLPDGAMERSKCAYKLLQYGAAGLPAAGGSVGVNAEILGNALASHSASSITEILRLTESERRTIANKLSADVVDRFSFGAWCSKWYEAVTGEPR
jgi:hypothetical protein